MKSSAAPITLNGSHGEGGSALFRTALCVAGLTQQSLRIHNIRGATRRPGLTPEDLSFLLVLAQSCGADLEGDEVGSSAVNFNPQRMPRPVNAVVDVQANASGQQPGNCLVVAEALLPVLSQAKGMSALRIIGETYSNHSITFDLLTHAILRAHQQQGIFAQASMHSAGFGFAARGEVTIDIEPSVPQPIEWSSRGGLVQSRCIIAIGDLPMHIAERGASQARKLASDLGLDIEVDLVTVSTNSPGVFVSVFAEFERGMGSGGAMGQRGVRIEHVVQSAFNEFAEWFRTDATVDPYLADQLLLPAVLAGAPSTMKPSRLTRRLITMAWVIKQFLPVHVTILGQEGEPGTVKIGP